MSFFASPIPVEDETLVSQMLRLTHANGLDSVQRIYTRLQRGRVTPLHELLHGPPEEWIRQAAEVTGIDAAHLAAGTRRGGCYPSLRTWTPRVDQRITVYCPACLADDGAWRLLWLLPYARVCPDHDLLLIDHRRSCHARRGLHRRWVTAAGSTQLCTEERCRFPRGEFRIESCSHADLDNQDELLRLDLGGMLRLCKVPSTYADPESEPPQLYERQKVPSRHERDPATDIEFLDRPL